MMIPKMEIATAGPGIMAKRIVTAITAEENIR
jgi:hypothetical protein